MVFIYEHVQSESTADGNADSHKKQLEKLEEINEEQREEELLKCAFILSWEWRINILDISLVYSSSESNLFLSYDKCMRRMKCPPSRQEKCSEECKAGR